MLSSLRIDSALRTADYAKMYQDVVNASDNYKKVIDLCVEFPEKNERILGSAYFAMGSLSFEQKKQEEAQDYFTKSIEVLRNLLVVKL